MGHNGNVLSNGLTYATPFPIMVFLGVKVVLPVFKAAETIPVCPGKDSNIGLCHYWGGNLLYGKFICGVVFPS